MACDRTGCVGHRGVLANIGLALVIIVISSGTCGACIRVACERKACVGNHITVFWQHIGLALVIIGISSGLQVEHVQA